MSWLRAGLVAGALIAGASGAAAQSTTADGVAALARGDYQRAVDILRPLAERDPGGDSAAQFFLGSMYDAGLGVPRDQLRACALYHRANSDSQPFGAAAMRLHKAAFQRNGVEFFAECQLIGNLGFDHRFEPVTFDLGAGHSVAWSLRGATISYQGRETHHQLQLAGRGAAYLPLRYTPLQPSLPSGPVRHFMEVFVWRPAPAGGWSLGWHLFEVVGATLLTIADDDAVMTSPTRPGPSPAEDVRDRAIVRVNADGNAEWRILEGTRARSALIESDEERRELRELEERGRAALEKVDWSRRFDPRRVPSLSYASSDGCGDIFLYAFTADRSETISIRADRSALELSTTPRSFDVALQPLALAVSVHVYEQPRRDGSLCSHLSPSPGVVSETWRAVAGRVTIELSPPGIRARSPSLYRATIRLDGAEFLDSSGRRHRQTTPIVLSAVVGSMGG
jgi:hypothetical protein